MNELELNETPVRTSRSFNINNIKIRDIDITEKTSKFDSVEIKGIDSKINIEKNVRMNYDLKYGLGECLKKEVKDRANSSIRISIGEDQIFSDLEVINSFDKENVKLIDNIEIVLNKGATGNIIIKYKSFEDIKHYHNGIIKVVAKKGSILNITVVNLLNINADNFLSIETDIEENASVNYSIIDFGGRNSITNYYSNLVRKGS